MTIFGRYKHKYKHNRNDDFPIEITEEGIEMSVIEEHTQEMLSLIVLIENRIETVFNDENEGIFILLFFVDIFFFIF